MRRITDGLRAAAAVLLFAATAVGVYLVAVGGPAGPAPAAEGGRPASGAIVPAGLSIPAIGVDTVVEPRGTVRYENPFTGQPVTGYDVPESLDTAAWWSDGPQPGSEEMAVVLGHQQTGGQAVFNRLHELRAGDQILFRDAGGAVLTLQVFGDPLTGLDKATSALSDALNGHPADADVALVTCGGAFDAAAGTSTTNTVVFAAVVDAG
ncbi:class F sortase [Blastococcus sp. PRF04-17]|uniref:class F sortase n=1 Tax=Blastococcus sp. PRF04-17 TaxID=2933797 RepID=UPI001FF5C870|nr:class F sortase [Blastococcus sp. PRF04-17]UOY00068.1 class F sortase [Blastococcus sp. PRF04-17]